MKDRQRKIVEQNDLPAIIHIVLAALVFALVSPPNAFAADPDLKGRTGLPLPRFASLKSDRVNLRQGPSREHAIKWVFKQVGLPVEIINEYENWRQVRASDGAEGWVFHRLLSARRTALILPWEKKQVVIELRSAADAKSQAVAKLENGVLANIMACDQTWCHVGVSGHKGYVLQDKLWGVYKNETIK